MNQFSKIILTLIICSFLSVHLWAQTVVVLNPSKDNSIYENADLSNGAGTQFHAGRNGANGGKRIIRSLIQFDLSSIPAGSIVISAELKLTKNNGGGSDVPFDVTLHKVTKEWGEGTSAATGGEAGGTTATLGDATWTESVKGTSNWDTAGGDFVTSASAQANVTVAAEYNWSGDGLNQDVQAWIDNPATNFGWIIRGNEGPTAGTSKRFASRTNATEASRPQLTVTYMEGLTIKTDANEWFFYH